jgi:thiopeptide-type bacteriocin biosynthesis protein
MLTSEVVDVRERPVTRGCWVYAKVFWRGDLDELLIDSIRPWVIGVRDRRLIDRFFFVRYWEGGQHLRLRCRLELPSLRSALEDDLQSKIAIYAPSKTDAGQWSVEFDSYEPESLRYGGAEAMDGAEAYFDASSRAALALLPSFTKGSSYRISAAIELLLLQLMGAGLSAQQCASFCRCTLLILSQYFSKDGAKRAVALFDEQFEANQSGLAKFVQRVVSAQSRESSIAAWMKFCGEYWASLARRAETGILECPSLHALEEGAGIPTASEWGEALGFSWEEMVASLSDLQRPLLPILLSHVHMTNNRVGVLKQNEPLVGYLAARTLEHLSLQSQVRDLR